MRTRRTAIRVVPTGTANLRAVLAAFERLGLSTRPVESAIEIDRASHVVLPGVGSFAAGIEALDAAGWSSPLRERARAGRPTLGICLGFQLLCEESAEAPGRVGLGCIPASVTRFEGDIRVPQLGWNAVAAPSGAAYLRPGVAYFANSYRVERAPPGWKAAISRYGGAFVAAVEREGVLACQFHPELSGVFGQRLLARWVERAPARSRESGGVPC